MIGYRGTRSDRLVYSLRSWLTVYKLALKTTVSLDVQTRFSVQLAFAKFLSRIKEGFNTVPVSWIQHSLKNFPLF